MAIINGTNNADILNGTVENDSLNGGIGNDTLNGGLGADILVGGKGDDVYIVDNVNDLIIEDSDNTSIIRVSTDIDGRESNGVSYKGHISANGSKVIFTSIADNLVSYDKNADDVFIKDLKTGMIVRLTMGANNDSTGISKNNFNISSDGNKVLFEYAINNISSGQLYIKNLTSQEVNPLYTIQANSSGGVSAYFSSNDSKVIFSSVASNLVEGDNNNTQDIFIKDLITGNQGNRAMNLFIRACKRV